MPALIARRLLLATVTTLFIFGWLGLWLVHVGTLGAAIFAAADIVVFTTALILCVRRLHQLEDQKRSRDELAKCVAAQTTELCEANIALKEKQQFLEVLLDNLNVGIIGSDAEGRATLLNRTIRQYNNLPTEGPVPDTSIEERPTRYGLYYAGGTELMRPEDTPTYRALCGESVREFEYVIMPPGGARRLVVASAQPLLAHDGRKLGAVVAVHDITDRKVAEQRLRESEAQLSAYFNASPAGRGMVDQQLRYLKVNQQLADITGFPVEEHYGKTIREIMPQMADTLEPLYQEVFATGRAVLNLEVSGETGPSQVSSATGRFVTSH